jgi:hypothetical protein
MAAHVTLKSPAQGPFIQAVIDATAGLPAQELRRPSAGAVRAVLQRLLDAMVPSETPLERARLRGMVAEREIVSAEGGTLSGVEFGRALGVTRQAIDKRRKAGQLLALEVPKRGFLYPAWQLTVAGLLPGLAEVLAALPADSPWARARFFLAGNDRCRGKRPLDLLRKGEVAPVLRAAQMFGEHGAA